MNIIPWIIIAIICYIMMKSLARFINGREYKFAGDMRQAGFSIEIFYTLLITYIIVIIGFGLIYFTLSFEGMILIEYEQVRDVSIIGELVHSMYFSGVTMLTIGYGDVTPVGIGRIIAIIEALIGYILPTAFVLRLVQTTRDQSHE